jgi:hypothetical protein
MYLLARTEGCIEQMGRGKGISLSIYSIGHLRYNENHIEAFTLEESKFVRLRIGELVFFMSCHVFDPVVISPETASSNPLGANHYSD